MKIDTANYAGADRLHANDCAPSTAYDRMTAGQKRDVLSVD